MKKNFTVFQNLILLLLIFSLVEGKIVAQEKEFALGFSGTPHQICSYYNGNLNCSYWQNYNWYAELKMNLWQGWMAGSNLQYHLTSLDSLELYGMQGYYQPDTLLFAAFGKVSIHQAEITTDRYRYNNHHSRGIDMDDNWQGQTQRVRYYEAMPTGPYTPVPVLTELNENAENSYSGVVFDPIYQPHVNDNGNPVVNNYYIKPRMRISTTDAFGTEKPVVKIVFKNFEGNIVKEVVIKTINFRINDDPFSYDGSYIEEYLLEPSQGDLNIRGDSLNVGRVGGFLEWNNIDLCNVDYQIFWFGEVSVWIDYVKIMDEPAEQLFGSDPRVRDVLKDRYGLIINPH
jgi:hypothetical protein